MTPPGYAPAVLRRLVTLLTVGLLALPTAACAPTTPDAESWSDQALQALDDVGGEVATARLVLRQLQDDRATGEYAQTVALDSEEAAGTTSDGLAAVQPPRSLDTTYDHVTTALSDAADLLSDVRIAVVREDEGRYAGLVADLARARRDLETAADEVRAR